MSHLLALIRSMERHNTCGFQLWFHQGEGRSNRYFLLSENSLVISQQRVIIYDNAHTLRTHDRAWLPHVPVSIFTNDVNNRNNTSFPFCWGYSSLLSLCQPIAGWHTCHEQKSKSDQCALVPVNHENSLYALYFVCALPHCHYPRPVC